MNGCGRLCENGEQYCAEHKQEANRLYNKYERDPQTNKRYGRAWKRIRDRYIKAHPLCEECEKQGRLTPAEEIHHILPLSKGGGNEITNLMALCKSCHSRITVESGDRWGSPPQVVDKKGGTDSRACALAYMKRFTMNLGIGKEYHHSNRKTTY